MWNRGWAPIWYQTRKILLGYVEVQVQVEVRATVSTLGAELLFRYQKTKFNSNRARFFDLLLHKREGFQAYFRRLKPASHFASSYDQ